MSTASSPEPTELAQLVDLAVARRLDALERSWEERERRLRLELAQQARALAPRVGIGYDAHRLVEGRRLVLGGVEIEHSHGLLGHSDADAIAHACIEAILGAAAQGNIGQIFPDRDPAFKDADSLVLLRAARERVEAAGFAVAALDVTLLAERPRVMPHAAAMRAKLAGVLGLEVGQVSVKATTNEGLGAMGRQEGMAAIAVAVLHGAPAASCHQP